MQKEKPSKAVQTTLALTFLVALVLRLYKIGHGFPFIFHPDEPTIIRSALALRFNLNPEHFDWPHLYIYLNYFVYMLLAKFRVIAESYQLKDFVSSLIPILWDDSLVFYYVTRIFSAVLGALTVFPLYMAGRELFNRRTGLLAALTMAIIPFHIWHSHYSLSDVPMVFFLACGLYFSTNIMKENDVGHYAKTGFLVGLAASTKYNGGLSAIAVPLAHIIRVIKNKENLFDFWSMVNLVVSGIFSVAGFLLGTPFALLDFDTFIRTDGPKGALWQFKNVGSVALAELPTNFVRNIVFKLSDDLGYTILIGFFIVLVILIIRTASKIYKSEDAALWFLFIQATFLLLYISKFKYSRSHYFMIAYPYMAIVYGYLINSCINLLRDKWKNLTYLVLVGFLFVPFYYSTLNLIKLQHGDTRNILHTWLQGNLQAQDEIVYVNNNIVPVLEHTANQANKGIRYVSQVKRGYLVYSYDKPEELADYKAVTGPYDYRLEQVFVVDNKDFMGPNITIYKIK